MVIEERRTNLVVKVLAVRAELELVPAAELGLGQGVAELEHDPVAVELELGRVVAEPELVPAVAEAELARVEGLELGPAAEGLELGLAVAELELVQVEAVAVPGHPRGHLVLPLGTKSVTAPHRLGLPLLVAADLAAVVETTLAPAAAEAAAAWEVAE
jgi:glyoxylase-like metal-dependent hydrolase (beta-lactamase superfamily II)